LAFIPSPLHGPAADGFSVHVIAKCALVAPVERLQIQNGGIGLQIALWLDGVVRETLLAHGSDDLLPFFRLDPTGEAKPSDAGVILLKLQAGIIVTPFFP